MQAIKRGAIASSIVLVLVWATGLARVVNGQSGTDMPTFAVDPAWPKPLPNNWAVGPVSGITTDARDHIWIIHRGEAVKQPGRVAAPPVIEFDPAGNIVQTWGGPGTGYEWPQQVHGITIDGKDRVWISGNGEKDHHILVFTRSGKFLLQIGRSGKSGGSNDTANLARATQMRVDVAANEVYVSDGEMNQNHRVVVFDSETGAHKRHWGAYGEKPDDAAAAAARFDPAGPPSRHFGNAVHCLRIDRDGLVYVCDRSNSRFQIFRGDGTFQKEIFVANERGGTVADLDFSPDQRFLYVADGANQKVWILLREGMRVLGSFGGPGPGAGQFATALHDLTVDSKGNVYTGEAAAGGRVQKFRVDGRK
jgi:DNA-binding beta-propeller fold protein YncE